MVARKMAWPFSVRLLLISGRARSLDSLKVIAMLSLPLEKLVTAVNGVGFLPLRFRTHFTKTTWIRRQIPAICHLRNTPQTVLQQGNSRGSIRHSQAVQST